LGHEFEKLMRVNIFFYLFHFQFHHSILIYFFKWALWFSSIYFLLDYPDFMTWIASLMGKAELARSLLPKLHVCHVSSGWLSLLFSFFLPNFIIQYLISWKLNYIIFIFWKSVFLQSYSNHFFFYPFNIIVFFYLLIKIKLTYLTHSGP